MLVTQKEKDGGITRQSAVLEWIVVECSGRKKRIGECIGDGLLIRLFLKSKFMKEFIDLTLQQSVRMSVDARVYLAMTATLAAVTVSSSVTAVCLD